MRLTRQGDYAVVFLFKVGQSRDRVVRSMELFAREVMPRVRELAVSTSASR